MDTTILVARAHNAHSTTIGNLKSLAPEGEMAERIETLEGIFHAPQSLTTLEPFLLSEEIAILTTLLAEKQATPKRSKSKV